MIKRILTVMMLVCFVFLLSFCVSADCEHIFSASAPEAVTVYFSDGYHSFYCLEGCGSYGTESGGIGAREKCCLTLAFEKPSGCTAEGKQIYMCTVCFNRSEILLDKKPHSYVKNKKLPTCTEGGYDLYSCTGCDESYKINECPAIEHLVDGGVVTLFPTLSAKGILVTSCRICSAVIDRKELPSLVSVDSVKKTPGKIKNFRVKSYDSSSVNLAWDDTLSVEKYKINYSSDKKSWKSVVTNESAVRIYGLSPAKKYHFRISGVSSGITGVESETISVCTKPSAVVITSVASPKKSTAKIKWKKAANVSGYEISYTDESFSKKKSVKKCEVTKKCAKILKNLESGKKYRFRVRAYKLFSSKKIYGGYSKAKTMKIR